MMSVWFLLVGLLTRESSQGAVFIYLDNLDSQYGYRYLLCAFSRNPHEHESASFSQTFFFCFRSRTILLGGSFAVRIATLCERRGETPSGDDFWGVVGGLG